MDIDYPRQAEDFRTQIRALLAEHLPASWPGGGALAPDEREAFGHQWRQILADRGYCRHRARRILSGEHSQASASRHRLPSLASSGRLTLTHRPRTQQPLPGRKERIACR